MIVMVIIGLLAAIAVPMYVQSVRHAREAVLREDLRTLRSAIDSYTVDKQKAPQSLDDLVQSGYVKTMPLDPFTHRTDTWVPAQDDTLQSIDQTDAGINDVHSGAQEVRLGWDHLLELVGLSFKRTDHPCKRELESPHWEVFFLSDCKKSGSDEKK